MSLMFCMDTSPNHSQLLSAFIVNIPSSAAALFVDFPGLNLTHRVTVFSGKHILAE